MSTTATPTPTVPTLAQIEGTIASARRRAEELAADEQRLALDSLADDAARVELANAQRERDAVLLELHSAELAKAEHARRSEQAASEAEQARVDKEMGYARTLAPQLRAKAERIDSLAGELAAALASFAGIEADMTGACGRAEENCLHAPDSAPEAAIVHALRTAKVPLGMITFGGIAARPRPLAESVPVQGWE